MKIMKFSEIIVLDLRVKTSNYIAFKKINRKLGGASYNI